MRFVVCHADGVADFLAFGESQFFEVQLGLCDQVFLIGLITKRDGLDVQHLCVAIGIPLRFVVDHQFGFSDAVVIVGFEFDLDDLVFRHCGFVVRRDDSGNRCFVLNDIDSRKQTSLVGQVMGTEQRRSQQHVIDQRQFHSVPSVFLGG